jgi:hypothetical protein
MNCRPVNNFSGSFRRRNPGTIVAEIRTAKPRPSCFNMSKVLKIITPGGEKLKLLID